MEILLGLVTSQFKITIALATVLLGAFRWFLARHDLQFIRRKEFLQNWKSPRELDLLSIEVMTRQLFGAYLPAPLVRGICERNGAEVARTLRDLANVWDLIDWDGDAGTVAWKRKASTREKRAQRVLFLWISYFVAAFAGGIILFLAATKPVVGTIAAASSMWGLILVSLAVAALVKTDTWGTAWRLGDRFIEDINRFIIRNDVAMRKVASGFEVALEEIPPIQPALGVAGFDSSAGSLSEHSSSSI